MDIKIFQILFQLVNFSVVVAVLSYLLYGPIVKILRERSKRIEAGQKAAEDALAEKEALQETKKSVLKKAKEEANAIREKAQQDKKAVLAETRKEAKQKAEQLVEDLKADWQEEKKQHMAAMRESFADAVVTAAAKVSGASLKAKDHKKLIDTELETLLKKL